MKLLVSSVLLFLCIAPAHASKEVWSGRYEIVTVGGYVFRGTVTKDTEKTIFIQDEDMVTEPCYPYPCQRITHPTGTHTLRAIVKSSIIFITRLE